MADNNDGPPVTVTSASRSSTPPQSASGRMSDVSARLQHLRNLLNSDRQGSAEHRRATEALEREALEMSAEPITSRLDRRRRGLENQIRDYESTISPEPPSTGTPATIMRSRRRITRPSERLQRHRDRLNQIARAESLNDSSFSELRPLPPIPPDIVMQEHRRDQHISHDNRRLSKRRKLEDGSFQENNNTFSYGYKGEVVPTKLKMEIVHCDGGEYPLPSGGSGTWPHYVLRDDESVYCTKSNQCNMLLGHVGGMPFSLQKLVIKAPRVGFDAPIQEGLIFIQMDDRDILEKTSYYEIKYSPRSQRYLRRNRQSQVRLAPSHNYFNSVRSPLRSIDNNDYLENPYPPPIDYTTDNLADIPLVAGFDVSRTFDDDSSEHEYSFLLPPSLRELAARRESDGRGHRDILADWFTMGDLHYWREGSDSGSSGEEDSVHSDVGPRDDDPNAAHARRTYLRERDHYASLTNGHRIMADELHMREMREWGRRRRMANMEQADYRRSTPSIIEVRGAARNETHSVDVNEAMNGKEESKTISSKSKSEETDEEDLLKPHARFFIRRDKSSVSIHFDPPVAGRFILIKLWAPCPNANIDIQSIAAHGWGAPRFFPALEPR